MARTAFVLAQNSANVCKCKSIACEPNMEETQRKPARTNCIVSASILIRIWNISMWTLNRSFFFQLCLVLILAFTTHHSLSQLRMSTCFCSLSLSVSFSFILFAKQTHKNENYDNVMEEKTISHSHSECLHCVENVSLDGSIQLGVLIWLFSFFLRFRFLSFVDKLNV